MAFDEHVGVDDRLVESPLYQPSIQVSTILIASSPPRDCLQVIVERSSTTAWPASRTTGSVRAQRTDETKFVIISMARRRISSPGGRSAQFADACRKRRRGRNAGGSAPFDRRLRGASRQRQIDRQSRERGRDRSARNRRRAGRWCATTATALRPPRQRNATTLSPIVVPTRNGRRRRSRHIARPSSR